MDLALQTVRDAPPPSSAVVADAVVEGVPPPPWLLPPAVAVVAAGSCAAVAAWGPVLAGFGHAVLTVGCGLVAHIQKLESSSGQLCRDAVQCKGSCYEHQRIYTYIQSRFYRAPEVILGAKYGMPIDMWSLGCILAELLTGYPLFPGEDEGDQLATIIELQGTPPQKLLDQSKRARNFISSKGHPRYCTVTTLPDGSTVLQGGRSRRGKTRGPPGSKDLVTALKGTDDPLFLDFMRRCLEWDPTSRMNPGQALRHAWLRRRLPKPPPANENRQDSANRKKIGTANTSTIVSKIGSSSSGKARQAYIQDNDQMLNARTKLPQIGSTIKPVMDGNSCHRMERASCKWMETGVTGW
ncbi:DYRK2-like protein [Mya arenaria]|uniref:DYRK2-like protein n=1 Tax=Mya arenaria TaxID=6604 RepID=A0ABY7FVC0_MYAAR|nr:DYRK2-like protein [Mya arenaria]